MKRPLIIGITGSIASGKSEVTKQLQETGFKVYSTDKLGHDVLLEVEVKDQLVKELGSEILEENTDIIDRVKLGKIVFQDKSKLAFLNAISHQVIFQKMREIIANSQEKQIFFEVPLLFEAKLEKHFDFIITVSASPENQLLRLMKRNNLSKDQALNKISSQLTNKFKETKSDFVISNNGDLEELKIQTSQFLQILPSLCARNTASF